MLEGSKIMKTLEEIRIIREEKRRELDLRVNMNADTREKHILVCHGTGCTSSKSPKIIENFRKVLVTFKNAVTEKDLENVNYHRIKISGKTAQIIVWVTNPEAAGRIATVGRKLADEHSLELHIVSIQNPVGVDNWEQTFKDLEALNSAARSVQAELGVVYSDKRMEAAIKLVRQIKPKMMVTGVAGDQARNLFIENLRTYSGDIPVYAVDPSGNTIELI
jgi:K+-sensing histidine kinase KdpD